MNSTSSSFLMRELAPLKSAIEGELSRITAPSEGCPERLSSAIRYSVLAPGKRLRPLLCLLACEATGGDWQVALPAACAVEFIHVYSLIHDDLPAMDNDTLRRGLPCCHIQFDEATAILAGDSLQMLAVQTLCEGLDAQPARESLRILSAAAGRDKLVGGQADDLAAEGRFGPVDMGGLTPLEFLKRIHSRKTSALIEASLQLGGVIAGGNLEQLKSLTDYGTAIGLAFQIVDDCLDIESTADQLGKHTRKDNQLGKLTYPSLLGLEASREFAEQLVADACTAIEIFKDRSDRLARLARFVVDRKV